MNTFTQSVWEALIDDEALLADLKHLLLRDYAPFLTAEQSVPAHTHALRGYVLDKLNQWYDWLPNTTINLIGGELALEAFQAVDWGYIAAELRKRLISADERERQPCQR